MKQSFAWLAGFSLLLLVPCRLLAWGDYGHKVIAQIALDNLSGPVSAKIVEMINDAGYTSPDQLVVDGLGEHDSQEGFPSHATMMDISIWPDYLLTKSDEFKRMTAPWHYLSMDRNVSESEDKEAAFCRNNDCLPVQVNQALSNLTDSSVSVKQKFVSLAMLINLMGDIHQPLNCSDEGDHNGTEKYFTWNGSKPISLHSLWNNLLRAGPPGGSPVAYAKQLEAKIKPEDRAAWESGVASDWAWESYQIADDKIYALPAFKYGPQNVKVDSLGNLILRAGSPVVTRSVPFPEAFHSDDYRQIVETQLEKSGIRLAWLLNQTLGK
ncbi:MAG TPA: S1/P1 nuclease [bacterium]|nr:S1/P1 nuclease [bacterium]